MILLLAFILILVTAAVTGHLADSRDVDYRMLPRHGEVPKAPTR
jgi:hypothetical protein